MKNFFTLLVSVLFLLFLTPSPIGAEELNEFTDFIDSTSGLSEEEIEELVIEEGERFANKQGSLKTSGETWTISSTKTLKEDHAAATKFIILLSANTSETKNIGFSFSAGTKIGGFNLTGAFNASKSQTRSGPATGQKVGNSSKAATHAYFIGVQYGKVVKYTYTVTDKYSGKFLRNETATLFVGTLTTNFALRANIGNPKVIIENSNQNKSKTFDNHNAVISNYGNNKTSAIFW